MWTIGRLEHKWDGIRSQTIFKNDQTLCLESRRRKISDAIIPWVENFGRQFIPKWNGHWCWKFCIFRGEYPVFQWFIQKRIGRKTVSKALTQKVPVILTSYDVLRMAGKKIFEPTFFGARKILDIYLELDWREKRSFRKRFILAFSGFWTMTFATWEACSSRKRTFQKKKI